MPAVSHIVSSAAAQAGLIAALVLMSGGHAPWEVDAASVRAATEQSSSTGATESNSTIVTLPMYGGYQGPMFVHNLYWIEVMVGGSLLKVQVDTGSSDLAVLSDLMCDVARENPKNATTGKSLINAFERSVCDPRGANHDMPLYNPLFSGVPTNKTVHDIYVGDSYGDGSGADTVVFLDTLSLLDYEGNNTYEALVTIPNVGVGAAFASTPGFEDQGISGIVGLAAKSASNMYIVEGILPVFDQIVADSQGTMADQFTLCFNADGQSGGKLVMGGGATPDMEYAPFTFNGSFLAGVYSVPGVTLSILAPDNTANNSAAAAVAAALEGEEATINMGTKSAQLTSAAENEPGSVPQQTYYEAILDSGTTGVVLPPFLFNEFERAVCDADAMLGTQLCNATSLSFNRIPFGVITEQDLASFPTIVINLSPEIGFTIPPAQYLASFPATALGNMKNVRSNVVSRGRAHELILGDAALVGQKVLFDRANMQVGIAATVDCSEY